MATADSEIAVTVSFDCLSLLSSGRVYVMF